MCEFHDCNCNGLGDIWWTDKCMYFSSIDGTIFHTKIPSETWTHPPTSIVISDLLNFFFFAKPLSERSEPQGCLSQEDGGDTLLDGKEQGKDGEPAVETAEASKDDSTETADKSDTSQEKASGVGPEKEAGTSQNKESQELQVNHVVQSVVCYVISMSRVPCQS